MFALFFYFACLCLLQQEALIVYGLLLQQKETIATRFKCYNLFLVVFGNYPPLIRDKNKKVRMSKSSFTPRSPHSSAPVMPSD